MTRELMAGLVLISWVANGVFCSLIAKRAWRIPAADEEAVIARYGSRLKEAPTLERLKSQIPSIESMVPGLGYVALVPLALSVTFGVNALAGSWLWDDKGWMWGGVALALLPVSPSVYLLAWEQSLLLARLKELAYARSAADRVR